MTCPEHTRRYVHVNSVGLWLLQRPVWWTRRRRWVDRSRLVFTPASRGRYRLTVLGLLHGLFRVTAVTDG